MASLLVTQVRARRVIAAVDGCVTVEARAVEDPVARLGLVGQGGAVVQGAGVPGVRVALLAEERYGRLLQLEMVRAVRGMAVQAALTHRRVLPEERTALLGVAGVALLVDRSRLDHLGRRRAVGVVAVCA